MSVKHGLLSLLGERPMYGAQLRAEFEARTGGTWPINIGQVYTTLDRLIRDGLVAADGTDDSGTIVHHITQGGRAELQRWWDEPVERQRTRSELAIKLAMAVTAPGVDIGGIISAQRVATIRHLQDLTRLQHQVKAEDVAWSLVLQNLIFADEAELRWLDHTESQLLRAPRPTRPAAEAVRDVEQSAR